MEKFKAKIFESKNNSESREPSLEELNNFKKLEEQFFRENFKIGKGEHSFVYEDDLTNTCYKVGTKKSVRNIHEEAEFYNSLSRKSEKVIIPEPYFSFSSSIENVGRVATDRRILAMEKINGANFQEILENTKELPDNFDYESFFKDLEDFFNFMHNEAGIFHCDFAPRNLMIDYKTGRPVVIDFGNSVYRSWFTTDEIKEGKQYEGGTNDLAQLQSLKESVGYHLTKITK